MEPRTLGGSTPPLQAKKNKQKKWKNKTKKVASCAAANADGTDREWDSACTAEAEAVKLTNTRNAKSDLPALGQRKRFNSKKATKQWIIFYNG